MSLKTRCPACDTVFKIVPDQLKVSKGWVRCGRCAEVFDAAAHAASSEDINHWPQTSTDVAASSAAIASAVLASSLNSAPIDSKNTPKNIADQAINTLATTILTPENAVRNTVTTSPDLSFVRVAKNKAFWQCAAVTRTLNAMCIGLAGLLFVQVVYSQRNHLAASNPALKSGLDAVCQTVGCGIEPFRNIDAFKIESSSFQKAVSLPDDSKPADTFSLKLSLKNNADMPLAIPAVELTLTEVGDKPVIRRVLTAKDLGYSNATLAANSDWTGAAIVVVSPNPAMPTISGYRVLLFYP